MADQKITELTELTAPASIDLLAIVDDPAGTPATKKITLENLHTIYDATNDGNPQIRIGSADANEGHIQAVYNSGAQTLNYLLISTDSGEKGDLIFNPKGNVGIGVTSPSYKLVVNGDIRLYEAGQNNELIFDADADKQASMAFKSGNNNRWIIRRKANEDDLKFYSYGIIAADVMTLQYDSGNVGIGLIAPLAKLHIDQSVSDAAIPVLSLDQADLSDGFINFIGATAASAAGPISSWTAGNSIQGFVRAEINSTQYWLPYYDDPTS